MNVVTDYYEVLQVSPNADSEVIQAAYRRLAMKWHPDRNPGDPFAASQMKLLNEAYEVLSDPTLRREYDSSRSRTNTSGGRKEESPRTKASPPKPESAPPPSSGDLPVSSASWSRAIPDAPAILIAGGVLFLIGHYDILFGKSPAGLVAFLLTCFIWLVLFGTPTYLCVKAKKRPTASIVAMLFLLSAGFDIAIAVHNRHELMKMSSKPRPGLPAADPTHDSPFLAALNPKEAWIPKIIQQARRDNWSWERLESGIKEVGGDPKPYRQPYQLIVAQRKQATRGETQLEYLIRRSFPVTSPISNSTRVERYRFACERFNAGTATQEDVDIIALFEWQQEIDQKSAKSEAGIAK